jgi:hypothetical protein
LSQPTVWHYVNVLVYAGLGEVFAGVGQPDVRTEAPATSAGGSILAVQTEPGGVDLSSISPQ